MHTQLLTVALPMLVLASCGLWVLTDARGRSERGQPVSATIGGVTIEQPEVWATLSVVVCIVVLPLYLVARRVDR